MNKKIGKLIKLTVAISMVLVNLTIPAIPAVNAFTAIPHYQVFENHSTRHSLPDIEYAAADTGSTGQDVMDEGDPVPSTDLAFNSGTFISFRNVLYRAGTYVSPAFYHCFVNQKDVIRC